MKLVVERLQVVRVSIDLGLPDVLHAIDDLPHLQCRAVFSWSDTANSKRTEVLLEAKDWPRFRALFPDTEISTPDAEVADALPTPQTLAPRALPQNT